ncbi:MAG: hypothetical protein EOP61_16280 [Sphingomonadales bacterium]|nr:MAG: hypothetical protein EOP61_16280 [Sphingomonadales bacterium]
MRKRFVLAAMGALMLPGAAQSQSFFSCKGNDGRFWGLHRVDGSSIQLWNPGKGWSQNLCAERECQITAEQIEMRWNTRSEGQYAYTDTRHHFSVNRRSGTGSLSYISDQWGYDGRPYTPNGWDPHSEGTTPGTCEKYADPEGGPPKF